MPIFGRPYFESNPRNFYLPVNTPTWPLTRVFVCTGGDESHLSDGSILGPNVLTRWNVCRRLLISFFFHELLPHILSYSIFPDVTVNFSLGQCPVFVDAVDVVSMERTDADPRQPWLMIRSGLRLVDAREPRKKLWRGINKALVPFVLLNVFRID